MSTMQEGSSSHERSSRKNDKGRRCWTENEESCLITSLKALIAEGWKSDNGFKAGYLGRLEEAMKLRFPNTDLRSSPHINSKLSTWKKNYYSLSNILGRSGIGFNVNGNHKIDCEDETWAFIVKSDPNARTMRYKPWPYYEEWKEIFGKDRANGENAGDHGQAWNEIRRSDNIDGEGCNETSYHVNIEDLDENEVADESMSATHGKSPDEPELKRKKTTGKDRISGVCDILVDIGRKTDERLASLVESLAYEDRMDKALESSFEELGNVPNLSMEDRFEVCAILGSQADKLKIFKGIPAASKAQYVAWLLKNHRNSD